MSLIVTPLTPAIGAEISGIDLTETLPPETIEGILQAWLDHGVIVIRDQDIDEHAQVRFARHFGELIERPRPREMRPESQHEKADAYDGYTMLVSNIRENGKPIGSLPDGEMHFHSDMSYMETPSRATLLYAIEVPKTGGDTLFASGTAAYDALDAETKALLMGRNALQGFLHGTTLRANNTPHKSFSHPAVRVIPETQRKSLFLSRLMSFAIEGLDPAQSESLLARLLDHMERPEFVYAHKWWPGDLLVWDNRTTVHARTDFDPNERRLLRRFATQGEQPVPA
ncbi:MAG: taurine dioxygenase [Alphaproteobacteria bacterium]|jgi:taurine dioxygenase